MVPSPSSRQVSILNSIYPLRHLYVTWKLGGWPTASFAGLFQTEADRSTQSKWCGILSSLFHLSDSADQGSYMHPCKFLSILHRNKHLLKSPQAFFGAISLSIIRLKTARRLQSGSSTGSGVNHNMVLLWFDDWPSSTIANLYAGPQSAKKRFSHLSSIRKAVPRLSRAATNLRLF